MRFQTLTLDQATYDPVQDRRVPLEERLESLHENGWELVTSYQATNYAGQPGVWCFIFRERKSL